jgi:hypothetical protein
MSLIANILYPVDFSPSCIAMSVYVKRAAALLGARVSLIHVVDPLSAFRSQRRQLVLGNASVFTDFQWGTFHLDEESPSRTLAG